MSIDGLLEDVRYFFVQNPFLKLRKEMYEFEHERAQFADFHRALVGAVQIWMQFRSSNDQDTICEINGDSISFGSDDRIATDRITEWTEYGAVAKEGVGAHVVTYFSEPKIVPAGEVLAQLSDFIAYVLQESHVHSAEANRLAAEYTSTFLGTDIRQFGRQLLQVNQKWNGFTLTSGATELVRSGEIDPHGIDQYDGSPESYATMTAKSIKYENMETAFFLTDPIEKIVDTCLASNTPQNLFVIPPDAETGNSVAYVSGMAYTDIVEPAWNPSETKIELNFPGDETQDCMRLYPGMHGINLVHYCNDQEMFERNIRRLAPLFSEAS